MNSRARTVLTGGAIAAAACAALLALAHVPAVQSRVIATGVGWLESRFAVTARVQGASFNLFTASVRLQGLTVAARSHPGLPFFAAEDLQVNLFWAALVGRLEFDSIEASNPVVTIVRDADGTLNVPSPRMESGGGAMARVPIHRLRIRGARVSYQDRAGDWAASAEGIGLALEPDATGAVSGRLVVGRGPSVRAGGIESLATRVDGSVTYDGASLSIGRLAYEAPEVRIEADGRLNALWSAPTLAAEISGTLVLPQLSSTLQWDPPAGGSAAFRVTLSGPLASPAASIAIDGDRVSWRHVGPASLRVRAAVDDEGIGVGPATATLSGGAVSLSGRFPFGGGAAQAHVAWQGLSAMSLLGPLAPFAVAARLGGSADATWNAAEGWTGLQIAAQNHSDPNAGLPDAVPVAGDASLVVNGYDWKVSGTHTLAGAVRMAAEVVGRLAEGPASASRLDGTIDISADDVGQAGALWRVAGAALPPQARPSRGRLASRLRIAGTLTSPTLAGEARLEDLHAGAIGPIQIESGFLVGTGRLTVDRLEASLGANRLTGSGTLGLADRTLRGGVSIELADLSQVASGIAPDWGLSGKLSGRADIAGSLSRPMVRGSVGGTDLVIAGQELGRLSAQVDYESGAAAVRGLVIEGTGGGRVTADGRYTPATGGYEIDATVSAFSLRPADAGQRGQALAAIVDGEFHGRGTIADPRGAGRVSFSALDWGELALGPAVLDIHLSDAGASLDARLLERGATVKGVVQVQAPWLFSLTAVAEGTDVALFARHGARLAPTLLENFEGRLSGSALVRGALGDPAATNVDAELRQLSLRSVGAELDLAQPVSLRYTSSRLSVGRLVLRTGSSLVEASGETGLAGTPQSLHGSLRGDLRDLLPWAALWGPLAGVAVEGAVAMDLSANGPLDRPELTGRLVVQDATVSVAEYPPASEVAVDARLEDGVIDLIRLEGRWEGATFGGRLRLPLALLSQWLPAGVTAGLSPEPALLSGAVEGLTGAALAPFTGDQVRETVDGQASLVVDLTADALALERMRGTIMAVDLNLRAAGVPVRQVQPTRIDVADGRVSVANWTWDVSGNRLTVAGEASLAGGGAVDLQVDGPLDLRLVGAFIPDTATAGTGNLSLRLRGPADSLLATGTLQVRDGELRISDPQIAASNVQGEIVFDGHQARLANLRGSLNGGQFDAAGTAELRGLALASGNITFTGTGIALNVPQGIRTDVDTTLALEMSSDRGRLSGRVSVRRGAYREPLSLAAGLASALRQQSAAAPAGGASSFVARTDLDVAVLSRDDLIVDTNYGRMDLGLDLRIVGTVGRPSVVGRAVIRDGGVLYLGGRTYQVQSGRIDFTDPRALTPELDLTARTRIAGYDVTLAVAGPPERLRTTLSSDPSLAQSDIVSLLATGRLADQIGGAETEIARDQILGYLSGEALGFAARAVRLDTLRLERGADADALDSDPSLIAGEVDPASRLTVSKRLSRYVEVTLSQNLRDQGLLTWIVTYAPRPNVELRAVSRDNRDRYYEIRHDVSFGAGPGGSRDAPARADPETEARIAAVRFTGAPGFPLADLERELKLNRGDRFDFYRWQQDRDRLRDFYLRRGYLEARIAARRTEAPDGGGTVLEYEISRGPLARLDVDGYVLPDSIRSELETLWSDAVFDEALFSDLERTVRLYMIEAGFLRARVQITLVESSAEEKRIAVAIAPGDFTRSRELRFEGNREASTDRLRALVAAEALETAAWLQPAAAARALTAFYAEEGFFAAKVAAGPAEFSSDSATLPIRIDEGAAFVITRVALSGTGARPEAEVRKAFGMEPGQRYLPRTVERGRLAVEADYARQGFGDARAWVEVDPEIGKGDVEVRLRVDEGRQQILTGITVEGGQGLRPDLVPEALKLEIGKPVDAGVWDQGRRRLLDTGLFRRVDIEAVPSGSAVTAPGTETVTALVSLARRPVWRLRYGFNVTDEAKPASEGRLFGAGLTADLRRNSLFGRPGTLGASARASADQRIARGFVGVPTFFGLPVASNLFMSRSRQRLEEAGFLTIVTDKTTFTAEQRFRPGRSVQVSYGYQFERNHTFDPEADPGDPLALDFTFNAARLTTGVTFDSRNDPLAPSRGLVHSSTVEYAPQALGSDVSFAKYSLQQLVFLPMGRSLVWASALRFGLGGGFGQRLLTSERFFAGGVNTVRGYADNSLGAVDFFGDPAGGQAVAIVNEEVRFPIFRWLSGVAFLDAGNVFGAVRDLSRFSLSVGLGGGLRFSTPVGLFRLDLGVPLSLPDETHAPRLHFSFGQMF